MPGSGVGVSFACAPLCTHRGGPGGRRRGRKLQGKRGCTAARVHAPVCVCKHARARACTQPTWARPRLHTHLPAHTHAHPSTCTRMRSRSRFHGAHTRCHACTRVPVHGHTCMHTLMAVHMHSGARPHAHSHACKRVYLHIDTRTHTHTRPHTCAWRHMQINACTLMEALADTCTYMQTQAHTCTRAHT